MVMVFLLDGIVVMWFLGFYGGEFELVVGVVVIILWGVGVGLVLVFVINKVD